MSSSAVQLTFTLRTSSNVRTVHLLGSWDGYKSQLPLSAVKDPNAKPGSWKGTFRFQGGHALKLGSRYWYYYIVDGYHVSHDPAKEFTTEKTTGRKLNILDVPSGKTSTSKETASTRPTRPNVEIPKTSNRHSRDIPLGRALSPGKIQHPKPQKPYASRGLREADYDMSPIEDLEERFAGTRLSDRHASSPSELSDASESSGTVFSSDGGSSPSSATSESDRAGCRCNRFGLTRDGRRVKLDCGGKRCGYDSSSSECNSSEASSEVDSSEEEENSRAEELKRRARARLEAERAKNGVTKKELDERRRAVVAERRRR